MSDKPHARSKPRSVPAPPVHSSMPPPVHSSSPPGGLIPGSIPPPPKPPTISAVEELDAPTVDASGPISKLCPTCRMRYPAEYNVCPRDASELEVTQGEPGTDELVGSVLAQTYEITKIIGEGGMGRVYEARHRRINKKRFAIKVLHPEYARQRDVLARFQREAEAAAAIDSPFVVDVYDVDSTPDGRPFIVGEFLDGRELAEQLSDSGTLAVPLAIRIARQLCKALAVAHDKGIVHRDIKPENVFLVGDPRRPVAKIIDFGISKLKSSQGGTLTKTGMIMGTPSYMAPEQARGDHVDHRADIYAVGAILYCALTGKRPFDRGDPTATLTAVLTEDPERPRAIDSSIPEGLELVIQRAMSKAPEDRYQTMQELDTDLVLFDVPGEDADATDFSTPSPSAMSHHMPRAPHIEARRDAAANLDRQLLEASMARPLIVLLSILGTLALIGCVVTMVAAGMRLARGGGPRANLTAVEAGLILGLVTFALVIPVLIGVRHVAKEVWHKQTKALSAADKLKRPVLAGLTAYGFAALVVRTVEEVVLRRAVGVAWPVWDLVLAGCALFAALVALFVVRARR